MFNKKTIPAVSIIIPMYNAEKYIGDCLDSILAQTFTDYEVIVVDDCSTDNSCAVVESYLPRFNLNNVGKLSLTRLKASSGYAGVPRNIGMKLARAKYVTFIDNDDMITPSALEELYTLAENFDADVVASEKFYEVPKNCHATDLNDTGKFEIIGLSPENQVRTPTLVSEDLSTRVKELSEYHFSWSVWSKLIRKEFLIENNLTMIETIGEDVVFTCCLVCTAKRYLRVPNIINFYRDVNDSIFRRQETVPDAIHKWMNPIIHGFKYVNDFLDKRPFFKDNPDEKLIVLKVIIREFSAYLHDLYSQVSLSKLNKFVRNEFSVAEDTEELTAFIFGRMNELEIRCDIFQKYILEQEIQIQKLKAQIKRLQR